MGFGDSTQVPVIARQVLYQWNYLQPLPISPALWTYCSGLAVYAVLWFSHLEVGDTFSMCTSGLVFSDHLFLVLACSEIPRLILWEFRGNSHLLEKSGLGSVPQTRDHCQCREKSNRKITLAYPGLSVCTQKDTVSLNLVKGIGRESSAFQSSRGTLLNITAHSVFDWQDYYRPKSLHLVDFLYRSFCCLNFWSPW